MTASCLYEGLVMHARTTPVAHRLEMPLWMLLLDLDELPALDRRLRLFSYNRKNVVALHDADFAHAAGWGVRASIVDFLAAGGVPVGDGSGWRFQLLCHARVLGYVFNPVAFVFCHAPGGALAAVVAEVRNTFGKVHRHLLDARTAFAERRHRVDKCLHVSPFLPLSMSWLFDFRALSDALDLQMDVIPQDAPTHDRREPAVLHARLSGRRHALDDAALARMLWRYPAMTARVMARIHWEALKLWLAGAPFHPEPAYDPVLLTRRRHAAADADPGPLRRDGHAERGALGQASGARGADPAA